VARRGLTDALAGAFSRQRFRWLWIISIAALITGTAVFLARHTWWDDEDFSTLRAAIASDDGFDGADEYDPIGDDHYNLPARAPRAQALPPEEDAEGQTENAAATPPAIVVERWTPEDKIVRVESPRPLRLALRLLNYPAWQVDVNGSRIQPESAEDSGQMTVPLPAAKSRITVRFMRTLDRTIGSILSLLSSLAAALLLWRERRLRQN